MVAAVSTFSIAYASDPSEIRSFVAWQDELDGDEEDRELHGDHLQHSHGGFGEHVLSRFRSFRTGGQDGTSVI